MNACKFYMNDITDPNRKKIFWCTRFNVLKEIERAHVNKFLVDNLDPTVLAQLGIAEFNYVLDDINQSNVIGKYIMTLRKQTNGSQLDNGDSIRAIGLEPNTPGEGKSGLKERLLGSTSSHVATQSNRPVLIVK